MVIEREALDELVERLAALPAAERSSVPGIKPARADLILAGAVVVQGVLEAGGFDGLEATEAGLREGVFFERLLAERDAAAVRGRAAHERAEPGGAATTSTPPTPATSPRSRSACSTSSRGSGCTTVMPRERELLWAACMLHDIGMSVDYDDHHKHSRYLILNGGLPGFSPVEVAIDRPGRPLPPQGHARARAAGGPVRAGRRGAPGPLRGAAAPGRGSRALARSARARRRLALLNGSPAAEARSSCALIADGEAAVPRWAASRETELFARAFHRDLSVAA